MSMQPEGIAARPWRQTRPPRRVLAIRLQAHGDTVLPLPYLQGLKAAHPGLKVDYLTRRAFAAIPRSLGTFDRVYALGGGRSDRWQRAAAVALLPLLWARRYDAVLDLQRNHISSWLRRRLRPRAWSAFDRYAPKPAGERTREAVAALGLGDCPPVFDLPRRHPDMGLARLQAAGWRPGAPLVVLNPAAWAPGRQWPLDHYLEFARAWIPELGGDGRFLVLGLARVAEAAAFLARHLGERLIDLTGRTRADEAFAILARASLVLSEDSGLMHMAWVQGVPTVALFGSGPSVWAYPCGPHTALIQAADLNREPCRHGDEHPCREHGLARVQPAAVLAETAELTRTSGPVAPENTAASEARATVR